MKRPLIDNQALYVGDISELGKESFVDLYSDDPLENALNITEK